LKRHNLIGCFACVLGMATMCYGQAIPTASRVGQIQAGVGGFVLDPDFAQQNIEGLTFYADYDFGQHLGAEGEIHYSWRTPTDVSENTYLLGPRYIIRHKKLDGYAKALFGVGHFGLQQGSFANPNTATYFTYALGAGAEFQATRHINVRLVDFEAQKWPGFGANGLSPLLVTVGVAWVFR
jgi:opacity protein-like surface antigen